MGFRIKLADHYADKRKNASKWIGPFRVDRTWRDVTDTDELRKSGYTVNQIIKAAQAFEGSVYWIDRAATCGETKKVEAPKEEPDPIFTTGRVIEVPMAEEPIAETEPEPPEEKPEYDEEQEAEKPAKKKGKGRR